MKENFSTRYSEEQRQILLLCSILHPRTKNLSFVTKTEREKTKDFLLKKNDGGRNFDTRN
jgi:hypothetical protein